MKKILKGLAKYVAFTILLACFLPLSLQHVQADEDEVEYSLPSYVGHLSIHDDGNATFSQEVTYDFDSDYKGQYVALGKIGGYSIMDDPKVSATVNGKEKTDITVEKTDSYDGIKLKVYNSGSDGDRVVLKVTWQIQQLLNLYSDIAVLNWFPISDWDKGFGQVDFTVDGLDASQGELYAHAGYFGKDPHVKRTATGYQVHVDNLPASGKLELHAYWPMTNTLRENNQDYLLNKTNEADFLKKERNIKESKEKFRHLFYVILPLVILSFVLVGIFCYLIVLYSTRTPSFPRDARLYEAPQDLAPLVLAKNVYNQSFDKTGLKEETGPLKFKHMVQATILDLIDRGYLTFRREGDSNILTRIEKEGLSSFEGSFLDMLFDGRMEIRDSEMFSRYYLDKDALDKQFKSARTSYEREAIRSQGKRVKYQFTNDGYQVAKGVEKEEFALGLPKIYRDFSAKEKTFNILGVAALVLSMMLCSLSTLFLFAAFGSGLGFYYILGLLPIAGLTVLFWFLVKRRRQRCLDATQISTYYQWHSFKNMIKSIPSFKKSELESVILWNRILVYATLYGQAKKVSDVLKRYNIHLSNPSLDEFTYSAIPFIMLNNVNYLESYVSASDTVSSFSINSNSGSGGFGGGGFSGGGGGGGGGAF
ncbi:DUF2207 domain-containing protein [Streptococcus thermophilus]|uniref:DUF2207 domain-containing protein n=1 Tax=Streptococcus thermophilus TaxID=1308 RepID=UPI000BAB0573|nr:DUF2207 domain-containing protein [Streptococcus thermophilus]ASX19388.1 hypothetical protein BGL51_05285 [Streptococcus thermophilus]QYK22233.1 DUF2207 domain-containing protein [Streptococcus thermophilus]